MANSCHLSRNGSCHITTLSEEIICLVFSMAVEDSQLNTVENSYATPLALAGTCKLFNRIATPLLYRYIGLSYRIRGWDQDVMLSMKNGKTKSLQKTLKASPQLRPLCRVLHLKVWCGLSARDFKWIRKLLSLLSHIRILRIFVRDEMSEFWAEIKDHFRYNPLITDLHLETNEDCGYISNLTGVELDLPNLNRLHLTGVEPVNSSTNERLLPFDRQRTSNVTKLDFWGIMRCQAFVNAYILWPKTLFEFSIRAEISNDTNNYISLYEFGSLLAPHRDTLRSLDLGYAYGGERVLNLLEFTSLKDLRVSGRSLQCSPTDTARYMLAPNLFTLTVTYNKDKHFNDESVDAQWNAINQETVDWHYAFAKAAIAYSAALRNIKIVFSPKLLDRGYAGGYGPDIYPWDFIDKVSEAIRPEGINITYNEPPISRKDYHSLD